MIATSRRILKVNSSFMKLSMLVQFQLTKEYLVRASYHRNINARFVRSLLRKLRYGITSDSILERSLFPASSVQSHSREEGISSRIRRYALPRHRDPWTKLAVGEVSSVQSAKKVFTQSK